MRLLGKDSGTSSRRWTWLAVAAAVITMAMLLASLVSRRGADGPTKRPAGESGMASRAPGWTSLDAGPLAPRSGASVTWTESEVIVLGGERHADGAAFDPIDGRWRQIAPSPLPPGVPQTAWTGDSLVAVSDAAGRVTAAYDPAGDSWRRLADAPPLKFRSLGGFGRPAFYRAGDEVVLIGAWAAYSPRLDRWRDLPAPPVGLEAIGGTQAVAVAGREVWLVGTAGATYHLDLDTGEWGFFPAPKSATQNAFADAVVVENELYFASEAGVVSRLDGRRWKTVYAATEGGSCVPEALSVRAQPVVRLCEAVVARSASGKWETISPGMVCCYRTLVSTGDELFFWDSNDDVRNDPSAPRKKLLAWNPG
jgi:hypothetical protein